MVRTVSSDGLFNAMTTGCRCVGNCAGIKKEKYIRLGIFEKASYALPFESGGIFARIAIITSA